MILLEGLLRTDGRAIGVSICGTVWEVWAVEIRALEGWLGDVDIIYGKFSYACMYG